MNKTLLNMKILYGKMGAAEKRIADYILDNPTAIISLSVSELATLCNCGDATVVRFARRLGYAHYQQLKLALARETDLDRLDVDIENCTSCVSIFKKLSNDIYCSLEETGNILKNEDMITIAETLMNANRIVVIGLGSSAPIALDFTHKLLRIGLNVSYYNDNHMQAIAAAQLGKNDVILGISHSGSSGDIVDAFNIAKKNGAITVGITGSERSPVSSVSDFVLHSVSGETHHRILGLTSRIAQLTILDGLYSYLSIRIEDSKERIERTEEALGNKKF